jgi:acetyltransferase-like isoleucine patch superfamily enzyme
MSTNFEPFIHPKALVDEGVRIGHGTRIWAFAHVVKGAVVGEDCNLCDHTFVEGGVRLGNRVTVKCGVYIWTGVTVEDDVHIGPCVVFTNDLRPRSRHYRPKWLETKLSSGCTLGANSTLLPVVIGRWAMVAAGAVVTRDVPDFALVKGNPARLAGWVCRCGAKLKFGRKRKATCACGQTYRRTQTGVTEEIQT